MGGVDFLKEEISRFKRSAARCGEFREKYVFISSRVTSSGFSFH